MHNVDSAKNSVYKSIYIGLLNKFHADAYYHCNVHCDINARIQIRC